MVTTWGEKGMTDGKEKRAEESMERGTMSGTMDMDEVKRRRSIRRRVTTVISRKK